MIFEKIVDEFKNKDLSSKTLLLIIVFVTVVTVIYFGLLFINSTTDRVNLNIDPCSLINSSMFKTNSTLSIIPRIQQKLDAKNYTGGGYVLCNDSSILHCVVNNNTEFVCEDTSVKEYSIYRISN